MTAEPAEISGSLWVAIEPRSAFVRVVGRASFAISPALKQFGTAVVNQSCKRFILDMIECESADSTFLGILAGLSMQTSKNGGGQMIIVNLSPKIYETISNLGLNRITQCYPVGQCPAEMKEKLQHIGQLKQVEIKQAEKKATAETIMEAHTDLIRLDQRNAPRFNDLLSVLRKDMKHRE